VLWCCWLGGKKGIWPVKTDLHNNGPIDATATHHLLLQSNWKWFTFLVPAYRGCPGKRPLNGCSSSRSKFCCNRASLLAFSCWKCTPWVYRWVMLQYIVKHVKKLPVLLSSASFLLVFQILLISECLNRNLSQTHPHTAHKPWRNFKSWAPCRKLSVALHPSCEICFSQWCAWLLDSNTHTVMDKWDIWRSPWPGISYAITTLLLRSWKQYSKALRLSLLINMSSQQYSEAAARAEHCGTCRSTERQTITISATPPAAALAPGSTMYWLQVGRPDVQDPPHCLDLWIHQKQKISRKLTMTTETSTADYPSSAHSRDK